jgi:hypothetical protein
MPRWVGVDNLRQRWDEACGLGLWNLLFVPLVCGPFAACALLIGQGADLMRANVPGAVTIAGCQPTRGGWNCDGPFTAADGSVRIERVRLYPYFAQVERPTGTVTAYVSGADATQAGRSRQAFPVPLWAGTAFGLIGVYLVYQVYLSPGTAQRRRRPPVATPPARV